MNQQSSDRPMMAGGVLDPIDHLYEMPRYYPQFAREQLEVEGTWIVKNIWNYLGSDIGELARDHGKFMHLIRLLNQLEDSYIPSFEEKQKMGLKIWELVSMYLVHLLI